MPIVAPLVALDVLVLCLWAIALALAIAVVMKNVGKVLSGIPAIGGALAGAMNAVAQVITNAAGTLEKGVDHLIGAAWHQLARYMDKLWSEIEHHGVAILEGATLIGLLVHAYHAVKALAHTLEREWHGIEHGVKDIEKKLKSIDKMLKKLAPLIGLGIGADLITHLIRMLKEWLHFKNKTLPGIQSGVAGIPKEIADAEKWVSDNFVSNATTDLEAAVAVGLAALGLSGLSCDSNPFKNNKNACGLWGDLGDILGLLAATLAVLNFEDLVKEMQALEEVTVTGLHDVLNMV